MSFKFHFIIVNMLLESVYICVQNYISREFLIKFEACVPIKVFL